MWIRHILNRDRSIKLWAEPSQSVPPFIPRANRTTTLIDYQQNEPRKESVGKSDQGPTHLRQEGHQCPTACGKVKRKRRGPLPEPAAPMITGDAGQSLATFWLAAIAIQKPFEFGKRALVYLALEFNDGLKGRPIFTPPPRVKLRPRRCTQAKIGIPTHQPQQKPNLFLPAIRCTPFATNPMGGYIVLQPFPRSPQHPDMLGKQAHFFMQFPIHRLNRRLTVLDSALRKLPRMLFCPLAPEYFVPGVANHDADVRAITISIEHGPLHRRIYKLLRFFHRINANKRTDQPTWRNINLRIRRRASIASCVYGPLGDVLFASPYRERPSRLATHV